MRSPLGRRWSGDRWAPSHERRDPDGDAKPVTTLVLFSLFNVFNARSDERSAFEDLFSNKWLWGAVLLSLVLQAAVTYVPFLQQAFSTVSLGAEPLAARRRAQMGGGRIG